MALLELTKCALNILTVPFRDETLNVSLIKLYTAWIRFRDGHRLDGEHALLFRDNYTLDVSRLINWHSDIGIHQFAELSRDADSLELRYQHTDNNHYMVMLQRGDVFQLPEDDEDIDFSPRRRICRAFLRFRHRSPYDVTELILEYAGPDGSFSRPVLIAHALWRCFDLLTESTELEITDTWGKKTVWSPTQTLHNIYL